MLTAKQLGDHWQIVYGKVFSNVEPVSLHELHLLRNVRVPKK